MHKNNDVGQHLTVFALLFFLVTSCTQESYEDCILSNVKGVTDKKALGMIERACREKTAESIPIKCRDIKVDDQFSFLGGSENSALDKCIAECKKRGFWDRYFGECRT